MSKTRPRRPVPAKPVEQPDEAAEELLPPDPPRPHKWLLVVSIVLWLVWLGFLLMMALAA